MNNQESYTKESSLTAPEDRNLENRWRPDQSSRALSEDEVNVAIQTLNNTSFTEKFPRVDRTYADPPVPMQNIGLISFIPAKGATPNKNGIYGFAKIRGNYSTEIEANQRAEFLIRNVDSYHQVYHAYVGRPFPLTESSDYSAATSEVDIRRDTAESVSSNIKDKKMEEQRTVDEIKQREEDLLTASRNDTVDPYEEYITLRVKKAQLSWTYLEHQKKLEEVKNIIVKTRTQISELEETNPEFVNSYYEKYMKARRDAGIVESEEDLKNNFIKFLVEDEPLPGIDF
jgi:hypothetical protein